MHRDSNPDQIQNSSPDQIQDLNPDQSYHEKDKSHSKNKTDIVIEQSIGETAFRQGNFDFIADVDINKFAIDRLRVNEEKIFDISPEQDPSQDPSLSPSQDLSQDSNLEQERFVI